MGIFLFYLLVFFAVLILFGLRVVNEYERVVVFFLGRFNGVRGPGLVVVIPVLEKAIKVDMRTMTLDIPSQKIITKDNVSIDVSAVAYFRVVDAQKSVIAIENVYYAVSQISQTTVRNVVGQFTLDQILSDMVTINNKLKEIIDKSTDPWGADVQIVEIKDIVLPDNMQRAMAQEAEAERDRRAKIVSAEAEFQAAQKLCEAADLMASHPLSLQLRTLQTMTEISAEKNSTIIFPANIMSTVKEISSFVKNEHIK